LVTTEANPVAVGSRAEVVAIDGSLLLVKGLN
jgi:hypothetical protein